MNVSVRLDRLLLRAVTWILERRFHLVDVAATRYVPSGGRWVCDTAWCTRTQPLKAPASTFMQHLEAIDERAFERRAFIHAQQMIREVEAA